MCLRNQRRAGVYIRPNLIFGAMTEGVVSHGWKCNRRPSMFSLCSVRGQEDDKLQIQLPTLESVLATRCLHAPPTVAGCGKLWGTQARAPGLRPKITRSSQPMLCRRQHSNNPPYNEGGAAIWFNYAGPDISFIYLSSSEGIYNCSHQRERMV